MNTEGSMILKILEDIVNPNSSKKNTKASESSIILDTLNKAFSNIRITPPELPAIDSTESLAPRLPKEFL